MYCYPSFTGAGNPLFLFLLIGNTSSVICAGCHVAIWILFSNRKSLECDVCAQRWLNVALHSQKNVSDHCLEYTWCYGWCTLGNNRNKVLDLL